jgi:hypothetical protein
LGWLGERDICVFVRVDSLLLLLLQGLGFVLYAHVVLTCDPFVCYRQLAE